MNLKISKVDFFETKEALSEELIKCYSEACGANDGCCSGGGTEIGGLSPSN